MMLRLIGLGLILLQSPVLDAFSTVGVVKITPSTRSDAVLSKKRGLSISCVAQRSSKEQRFRTALQYGELRGVDSQLLFDAWSWMASLGTPAALVAGAVLATMIDSRESMSTKPSDPVSVRIIKKLCRVLLLSSFALEVISIFVTTVTGTLLLSHGDAVVIVKGSMNYASPMGFLLHNYEFEYLTSRIALLQGLFHWLASVALEIIIPKPDETKSTRLMNQFTSSSLCTILIAMLSFLNRHLTLHGNYLNMLRRYAQVCFSHFIWPLRPLTALLIPMSAWTIYLGYRAIATTARLDGDDEPHDTKSSILQST